MRDPHHLFSPLPCFFSPLFLSALSSVFASHKVRGLKESDIMKIKIKGDYSLAIVPYMITGASGLPWGVVESTMR